MVVKKLDGTLFGAMLTNGLAFLTLHEDEINRLNVFPVADGDTGTNMRLTLAGGLQSAQPCRSLCDYLEALSHGMLMSARGNSGVILSQFFKGFYDELDGCGIANAGEFRNALIRGYRTAYKAMVRPVEGTVLTVMREGIENIRSQIDRRTTVDSLLSMYVAECKKSLTYTTAMLDVLSEANVVDSGAVGFIDIFEGMLMEIYGDRVEAPEPLKQSPQADISLSSFNQNSAFTDGYCMEFILQLMSAPKYNQRFKTETYISDLSLYGSSLAVVRDETRVKVHIHTHYPARVIAASQEYGEFITFKLENMQLQHNERDIAVAPKKQKHKTLATVAAVNGAGFAELLTGLGCDAVVTSGSSLNTSAEQFAEAIKALDADSIAVFPNNLPSVSVARQAGELLSDCDITVIPTADMAQCYFALALDIPDSDDIEARLEGYRSDVSGVITLCQATAQKDFDCGGRRYAVGNELVLMGDEAISAGATQLDSIIGAVSSLEDMSDRETCVVFKGVGAENIEGDIESALQKLNPMLDITFLDGGQELYHWLISIL